MTRGSWPRLVQRRCAVNLFIGAPTKTRITTAGREVPPSDFGRGWRLCEKETRRCWRRRRRIRRKVRRKREREREMGGSRELDRARRMRKEERNCRSNVASVRGVCLERRRLHQPSDRATRFSRSSHFYYRPRTVPTIGACRFEYERHS